MGLAVCAHTSVQHWAPLQDTQGCHGHPEREKRSGGFRSERERAGGRMGTWLGYEGTAGELPTLRVAKGMKDPAVFPKIEPFPPIATRCKIRGDGSSGH